MGWSISNPFSSVWNGLKKAGQAVENGALDVVHEGAKLGADIAGSQTADMLAPHLADRLDAFFSMHSGINFPRTLTVPRPASFAAVEPGQTKDVVPAGGYQLTDPNKTATFGLSMNQTGDAQLNLTAAGPGTNWGKQGAESAVMSVYVDGKYQQDVVLYGGDKQTQYPLSLGRLGAGQHTVTLRYAKEKSSGGAQGVTVSAGTATAVTYKTPEEAWAAKYAPILIGRHGSLENNHTDTPLGILSHIQKNPDGTTDIAYTTVYSNEDTGNGGQPALENALWGRLSDMETMFMVKVDAKGQLISSQYEDAGHVWKPFHGQTDGTHPIVRTLTDNNNVSQASTGLLRFQQPPIVDAWNGPQEDIMRQKPEWSRVTGEELQREGKIDPRGVGNKPVAGSGADIQQIEANLHVTSHHRMADPRDYLYAQFDSTGATPDKPTVVQVTLKNGKTFTSDQGVTGAAIGRDGWVQTSVELPPGTKPSDVQRVQFLSDGTGKAAAVGHLYMFDQNFDPQDVKPAQVG